VRIAFIGAGAVGSVTGGLLSRGGHDVTLVDQWPEHVNAIRSHGLALSGTCGEHVVRPRAINIHELQLETDPFDVVFVTVKSYDTEWATALMAPHTSESSVFLSLQNGINDERVAKVAGRERTLGTVTTIAVGMYEPGKAQRTDDTRSGGYYTGELNGRATARARQVAELLSAAGVSETTDDLRNQRWTKLAVNCALNATCGITGLGTNDVIVRPIPRRIGYHAAAEALHVAKALGVIVEGVMGISAAEWADAAAGRNVEEFETKLLENAGRRRNTGRASFGQDVLKGRRTEIEYLNGYVASEGRKVGVRTPVNDALVALVQSFPPGTLRPDPELLKPIYDSLS